MVNVIGDQLDEYVENPVGHSISAIILRGSFDRARAKDFGFRFVRLAFDLAILPLTDNGVDALRARLGIQGFRAPEPALNAKAVHEAINTIAPNAFFAVIETDYFGGTGGQAAAVYRGQDQIMAPKTEKLDRLTRRFVCLVSPQQRASTSSTRLALAGSARLINSNKRGASNDIWSSSSATAAARSQTKRVISARARWFCARHPESAVTIDDRPASAQRNVDHLLTLGHKLHRRPKAPAHICRCV